uniref:Transmembrane protein 30A n=1 Tax=Rhabditophanes sp. KR3021 TaxID=114890 RepID=A0AC35UHA3_9BILA
MSLRSDTTISENEEYVPNLNKPKDTPFRQQKLNAWQPVPTLYTLIPFCFLIALLFIPLSIILFKASSDVKEFIIDYTGCDSALTCERKIELESDYEGEVYFYYELDNFYQNHRRYQKSKSENQFFAKDLNDVSACDSYSLYNDVDNISKKIYPCGSIANSMFNDKFYLYYDYYSQTLPNFPKETKAVEMTFDGLLLDRDLKQLYKNPKFSSNETLCDVLKDFAKPPKWDVKACELDLNNPDNNGVQNFDFIIWMTTAGLSHFRKPYRKLNTTANFFSNGLPRGNYTLKIDNKFEVESFHGKKKFIITTLSWMGGKNNFLPFAFLIVAALSILSAIFLLLIHFKYGHSAKSMANVAPLYTSHFD